MQIENFSSIMKFQLRKFIPTLVLKYDSNSSSSQKMKKNDTKSS